MITILKMKGGVMKMVKMSRTESMNAHIKRRLYKFSMIGTLCIILGIIFVCMKCAAADEATLSSPAQTTPPPSRQTVVSGNYEYQIIDENSKAASLTKIHNYGEEVELPAFIDGYHIISIGCDEREHYKRNESGGQSLDIKGITVFSEQDAARVKKLIIPEGIVYIESFAFWEMSGLEYLKLPDSLHEIREDNFDKTYNLKTVYASAFTTIQACFLRSNIERLILSGYTSDSKYITEISELLQYKLFVPDKRPNKLAFADFSTAHISEMVVAAQIKKIILYGTYDKIILKNPKTKVSYNQKEAEVGTISAKISKITVKRKKSKYIYSWKPINITVHKQTYGKYSEASVKIYDAKSNIKYTVKGRNKKGKYKKILTSGGTKISSDRKIKLKVEAKCVFPKG